MKIKRIEMEWENIHSIYCSRQYLSSISSDYGWLAGYLNGVLILVIPFTVRKKIGIKIARFHLEPVLLVGEVSESNQQLFLSLCMEYFRFHGIAFCEQPPPHVIFSIHPFGAVVAEFGSYVIDLKNSEDVLWGNIHPKHRNVIVNAVKKGVQVSIAKESEAVAAYNLILKTMNRSSMPFISYDEFEAMVKILRDKIVIAIAYHDNLPVACAVIPYSNFSAYYQYGGTCDNPVIGAANLLHWELIKYFKKKQVNFYDFVGARVHPQHKSKQEGIQRFKSRFGGGMRTGYLWKMKLSYKFYIYQILRILFGRKHKDIIDQEIEGRG